MINSKEIKEIFVDCLFDEKETKGLTNKEIITKFKPIIVNGITMKVAFNPTNLFKNEKRINEILDELNSNFKEGQSFLKLCFDKNNNQWTGSHKSMEELMILGLAINRIKYCCKKDMWDILPGNMPYIFIKER